MIERLFKWLNRRAEAQEPTRTHRLDDGWTVIYEPKHHSLYAESPIENLYALNGGAKCRYDLPLHPTPSNIQHVYRAGFLLMDHPDYQGSWKA